MMDLSNVEPEEEQVEEVVLAGVWEIAQVDVVPRPTLSYESSHSSWSKVDRVPSLNRSHSSASKVDQVSYVSKNRFEALADDDVEEVGIYQVEGERLKSMVFNVADVGKPLAAAGKVVEAGNRVILDEGGSYIENKATGEKMPLRKEKGVYVFDVKYEDGSTGTITLDSGAGVSVWPVGQLKNIPMQPKKTGLRMVAANGTEIKNLGQKTIRFRQSEQKRKVTFARQS